MSNFSPRYKGKHVRVGILAKRERESEKQYKTYPRPPVTECTAGQFESTVHDAAAEKADTVWLSPVAKAVSVDNGRVGRSVDNISQIKSNRRVEQTNRRN